MGWSIGFVSGRDVGYGVPAICEHPACNILIDRGVSYACGGSAGSNENGCGMFFCESHRNFTIVKEDTEDEEFSPSLCERCIFNFELNAIDSYDYTKYKQPFDEKPDSPIWTYFKLTDPSWKQWRKENSEDVKKIRTYFKDNPEEKTKAILYIDKYN